jgi:hypothetical protein
MITSKTPNRILLVGCSCGQRRDTEKENEDGERGKRMDGGALDDLISGDAVITICVTEITTRVLT